MEMCDWCGLFVSQVSPMYVPNHGFDGLERMHVCLQCEGEVINHLKEMGQRGVTLGWPEEFVRCREV